MLADVVFPPQWQMRMRSVAVAVAANALLKVADPFAPPAEFFSEKIAMRTAQLLL